MSSLRNRDRAGEQNAGKLREGSEGEPLEFQARSRGVMFIHTNGRNRKRHKNEPKHSEKLASAVKKGESEPQPHVSRGGMGGTERKTGNKRMRDMEDDGLCRRSTGARGDPVQVKKKGKNAKNLPRGGEEL